VSVTEIITRRRKWSAAEKAVLLAEVEAAGGKVGPVARRHGISDSVLYGWRAAAKVAHGHTTSFTVMAGTNADGCTPEPMTFVPLGIVGASSDGNGPTAPPCTPPSRPSCGDVTIGAIEIMLPSGARICVDAFVNERALSRVLRAMKSAT
jgi:transposase